MFQVYCNRTCLEHDTGPGHPDQPARLQAILDALALPPYNRVPLVMTAPATYAQAEMVHPHDYLLQLEEACLRGRSHFMSEDCAICYDSFAAILAAAGTAVALGQAMADGNGGFALTRPPGHHAGLRNAEGFCYLNHAALAAAAYRLSHPGARILIVDFDVHYGNGIGDLFYHDPTTFYLSIHASPAHIYPWRGFQEETGIGEAVGTTCNITVPIGCSGEVWLDTFSQHLRAAVAGHQPEAVIVCAGFDAHRDDPFGVLNVEDEHFLGAVDLLAGLAGDRLGFVLEGGYNPEVLARLVPAVILRLAGEW